MSAANPSDHRLDHVVVIMFENRSFDNLLGYLYEPGEVPSFEGVRGKTLSNPVPRGVQDPGAGLVEVHPATSMASPYPDPGEEFPHVNTQLFGTVSPDANRFAEIDDMGAPFNAPPEGMEPTMSGFIADYVNAFRVQMGRMPDATEYSQIMSSYAPSQVPVLSALARGFACFDHWFCEVPSQTFTNRSFFHAGTSSGFVLNGHPPGKFSIRNDATTIFERLESAGRTWCVYIDPLQLVSVTALIHARRLDRFFATHFRTIYDFYFDAREGRLPNYAFIEPNMFHPHTDMHPHLGARLAEDLHLPPPDTLIGGEQLLADVYRAVRDARSDAGSNWSNTLLLVTFDEHGGTFDHVVPPSATPPDQGAGEEGFAFDRLGVRIPTLAISAWIEQGTVVTSGFQATSLIRTLRDWWELGPPLTKRDSAAPSFLSVLTRRTPRPPTEWPEVGPRQPGVLARFVEDVFRVLDEVDGRMERLERDLLGEALAWEGSKSGSGPAADAERLPHLEAHEHFRRVGTSLFPAVANGRSKAE